MAQRRSPRVFRYGATALPFMIAISASSLPLSIRWYDVQAVDCAIRRPPSFSPLIPSDRMIDATQSGGLRLAQKLAYQTTSWLGHDDLGRSLLFRIMPALLLSLLIGLAAATIAAIMGTLWGAAAAMAGGWIDQAMMRAVDVLYGLPYTLMIILMQVGLTPILRQTLGADRKTTDVLILLLAIGGVSWLTLARVVRGQVLSLRSQSFVDAAKLSGAGPLRILIRHLFPNLVGPIVVYTSLIVPQAILQEAFLSFLGIGVQPPLPSLGKLAAEGVGAVNAYVDSWWLLVFPCGAIVVALMSLNFAGDRLRDRLDPKRSRIAN